MLPEVQAEVRGLRWCDALSRREGWALTPRTPKPDERPTRGPAADQGGPPHAGPPPSALARGRQVEPLSRALEELGAPNRALGISRHGWGGLKAQAPHCGGS